MRLERIHRAAATTPNCGGSARTLRSVYATAPQRRPQRYTIGVILKHQQRWLTTSASSSTSSGSTSRTSAPHQDRELSLGHAYVNNFHKYLASGTAVQEFELFRRSGGCLPAGSRRYLLKEIRSVIGKEHAAVQAVTAFGATTAASTGPGAAEAAGGVAPRLTADDLATFPKLLRQMQISDAATIEALVDIAVARILRSEEDGSNGNYSEQEGRGSFRLTHSWSEKGQEEGRCGAEADNQARSTLPGQHLRPTYLPPVPQNPKTAVRIPSHLGIFLKLLSELPVEYKGVLHGPRYLARRLFQSSEESLHPTAVCCILTEFASSGNNSGTAGGAVVPLTALQKSAAYSYLHRKLLVEQDGEILDGRERDVYLEKLLPLVFADHGSAKGALGALVGGGGGAESSVDVPEEQMADLKFFLGRQFAVAIEKANGLRDFELKCVANLRFFTDDSYRQLPLSSRHKHPDAAALLHQCLAKGKALVSGSPQMFGRLLWHTRGLDAWARMRIVREWLLPTYETSKGKFDLYLISKWLEMMADVEEADSAGGAQSDEDGTSARTISKIRKELIARTLTSKAMTSSVAASLLLATGDEVFLRKITEVKSLSPGDLKKLMKLPDATQRLQLLKNAEKELKHLNVEQLLVLVVSTMDAGVNKGGSSAGSVGEQAGSPNHNQREHFLWSSGSGATTPTDGDDVVQEQQNKHHTVFEVALRERIWRGRKEAESLSEVVSTAMKVAGGSDSKMVNTLRYWYTLSVLRAPKEHEF